LPHTYAKAYLGAEARGVLVVEVVVAIAISKKMRVHYYKQYMPYILVLGGQATKQQLQSKIAG
jgi:hypothetical protein